MTTDDPIGQPVSAPQPATSRRRWSKLIIALIVANALMLVVLLVAVPRVTPLIKEEVAERASEVLIEEATVDEEVVSALTPVPEPELGEPLPAVTFLVMGSDSREDLPEDFGVSDYVLGRRADVVMIATLDGEQARVLSLPRDLRVEIEGYGTNKLNAAYAFGGPSLMVRTVSDLTGIDIHHYLELDFFGFASIVDELGGVEISFPYPARDLKSFLDVEAGRQLLDGRTALAYARSRQYEELRDGGWVTVDGSDLGRIRRQQTLLFAMLASAKRPSIIFDAADVLRAAGSHATLDASLDSDRLADLVLAARRLDRDDVEVATLPVVVSEGDGVYYLVPDQPEATEVIAAFLGATPESVEGLPAYESLTVKVLNGNGGSGQATAWSTRLESHGFGVVQVGDAASFDFRDTVVTVRPEEIGKGLAIVEALGFGKVESGSVGEGLDAVVIVGADALGQEALPGQ